MDSSAFQLIPTDVIKAWSKGEYYVGDIPSISYRHLGIALLLRGWYTYVDKSGEPTRQEWSGVAKVDIKGSVLSMGGIRLFGQHAVFWRTEHSYIQDDKEIIWFYSGFNCDAPTQLSEIRKKYVKDWHLNLALPQERFGMSLEHWKELLSTLATDFDNDVEQIAQARSTEQKDSQLAEKSGPQNSLYRDLGMLRFSVDLEQNERVRKCEYYHYDSVGQIATAGLSEFRKVSIEGVV